MRRPFEKKHCPEERPRRRGPAHLLGKILMFIGLLTVLYFLIVYAIIPLLALMTP